MNTGDWLSTTSTELAASGIGSARLDALILLEDATNHDRAWLLAHPEHELEATEIDKLNKKVARRKTHEPLAYIRGKTEFYGRNFIVDQHVLEPRPESETMIDLLKSLNLSAAPALLDVGTGSGALAISAKLELPASRVSATDIDPACLKVARRNAEQLSAEVSFIETDLTAGLAAAPDVILANLPYVPDDFHINLAAGHEPHLAIFGGPDGLEPYRRLFKQLQQQWPAMQQPHFILAESLPIQHQELLVIATQYGYRQQLESDFIQVFARQA